MQLGKLDRVIVIGTSGAGKTTFARSLTSSVKSSHVELDCLFWRPGWTPREPTEFNGLVTQAVAESRWVVDGNYSAVRDIVWPRATDIIWLDYSFPVVFSRAVRRTIRRVFTGESIHGGNRETIRDAFFSRDGIPWWVLRTFWRSRREYRELLGSSQYAHINVTVLRRPNEAEAFLRSVSRPATANSGVSSAPPARGAD